MNKRWIIGIMRIGQKIKNGLRIGLKLGAGALAIAGVGYLGAKGHEYQQQGNQAQQSNQLGEALSLMSPEQAQQFIETCMRAVPSWCEGMPLDCESGVGKTYGSCG